MSKTCSNCEFRFIVIGGDMILRCVTESPCKLCDDEYNKWVWDKVSVPTDNEVNK